CWTDPCTRCSISLRPCARSRALPMCSRVTWWPPVPGPMPGPWRRRSGGRRSSRRRFPGWRSSSPDGDLSPDAPIIGPFSRTTMNKRDFLAAAALGSVAVPALAQGKSSGTGGTPALLTVTGAIGKTNRGPFDPVVDQMMGNLTECHQACHARGGWLFAGYQYCGCPEVPLHRRALPGRKADGAGRTGASLGHL